MSIEVTQVKQLSAVTDIIHDQWFDVEDVTYDEDSQILTIPFDLRETSGRSTRWILEIGKVGGYTLEESENVGRYDFNELRLTPSGEQLRITTGIPLRFDVIVHGLLVRVYPD